MSEITSRRARIAAPLVVVAAVVASGIAISTASYSAFSDTTSNPGNSWSAGSVQLVDDGQGEAMFSAEGLEPGATGTNCIAVTSQGSLASAIKLYGVGAATTNGLSSAINLTVEQGDDGGFGSCDGFVAYEENGTLFDGTLESFGAAHLDFSTGLGDWVTSGSGETRVYRFTYQLDADAPNTAQGGTAELGLTWEAQNS
jgi:hypothetical protein